MQKSILLLLYFFCVSNVFATTEKAYIVFSAGLNEIENRDKGSYPELASVLDTYRQKKIPTFFIFGGASLFPSVLSSFDHGAHIIALLNSLEPDVMAANKGDFAFAEDELSLRSYEAAFPIVQSNIKENGTNQNINGVLDSQIIEQGDYKLGFISVMDNIALETYNLTHIKIENQRIAIAHEASKLRHKGADFIILHYGESELNCIDFINEGIVDLVLRNPIYSNGENDSKQHTHPRQVFLSQSNQVAIVELNWQAKQSQTLTVQWQNKKLLDYPKNAKVKQQIEAYAGQLSLFLDETIGVTKTKIDLSRSNLRVKENGLGNLLADIMKKHSAADIALINSGAIRSEGVYLKGSQISRRDIRKILPYRDPVVLLAISGAQLLAALENGFSEIEKMNGRFPQVSGMKVVYNSLGKVGQRVSSVMINNRPLDPLSSYKLATTGFVALGGDGYQMLKKHKHIIYDQQMSKLVSDMLINELRFTQSISPESASRLIDTAIYSQEP